MRVSARVLVLGLSERAYNGRVYKAAQIYVPGADSLAHDCAITDAHPAAEQQVKDNVNKMCDAVLNIRTINGKTVVDCVQLIPVK